MDLNLNALSPMIVILNEKRTMVWQYDAEFNVFVIDLFKSKELFNIESLTLE